jgi:DNA-binding CsgD family transcriptional regulator
MLGARCLTEAEAKRLSWSALQLAAVPSGPWFVPAVVAISRFLLDGEAAGFDLIDTRTRQTVVHHVEPQGWIRGGANPANEIADQHRLTITLPSRTGYLRSVSVWRLRSDFCSTDHLLLECLRPHLIIAWNRCAEAADGLRELDWSSVPVLRLGIDARGTIEVGTPPVPGSEVVAGWLNGQGHGRVAENDLHIADDGSFSILGPGRGDTRAAEVHGWLLSRPEEFGSDMFLWSSSSLSSSSQAADRREGAERRPRARPIHRPIHRPTFAQVERVARAWRLTPKQRLVIEELVTGKGNKDIAETLSCAEVTVEYHLTAIRRKAGVANRAALISRFWIDAHDAHGPRSR